MIARNKKTYSIKVNCFKYVCAAKIMSVYFIFFMLFCRYLCARSKCGTYVRTKLC